MCQAKRVQHDMLESGIEGKGRVGWNSSEITGMAGQATLGCFLPVYDVDDMRFTVKGYSMCHQCVWELTQGY